MRTLERIANGIIAFGRRHLAGTRLENSALTRFFFTRIVRLSYGDRERIAEYQGIRLALPTADVAMTPAILAGYYERLELDVFRYACRRARIVIDAGGNAGLYAIVAASLLPETGEVHSFEPVPENVARLERNLALNEALVRPKVVVHASALGASVGDLTIYLADAGISRHSAAASQSRGTRTVVAPMTTVDAFVAGSGLRPAVLKIDVEGYDGYVVRGALATLRGCKPTVLVEYAPDALRHCGFEPGELLDDLFDVYGIGYRIDEIGRSIVPSDKAALARLAGPAVTNLVFTDDDALALAMTEDALGSDG